jgi:MraZ protein
MALFLSTYVNKVDRKGRVSVPAPFRAVLAAQPFAGIVAYRSFLGPVIEASGIDRMTKFSEELESLDEDSERYQFIGAILADTRQLQFDSEGRIMLPPDLAEFAGITEEAAFVGQGKFFHIREPSAARTHLEQTITKRRSATPKADTPGNDKP